MSSSIFISKLGNFYNNFENCFLEPLPFISTEEGFLKSYCSHQLYDEKNGEWISYNRKFLIDEFIKIGDKCFQHFHGTFYQKHMQNRTVEHYREVFETCFDSFKQSYLISAQKLLDKQIKIRTEEFLAAKNAQSASLAIWNNLNFEDLTYMEMGGTALSIGAVAATTFYFLNKSYQDYTSFRRIDGTKNLLLGITTAAAGLFAGMHYYSHRL